MKKMYVDDIGALTLIVCIAFAINLAFSSLSEASSIGVNTLQCEFGDLILLERSKI